MNVVQELKVFAKDLSILITEDQKELNQHLVEILELFFKEVKYAYDGVEALTIYKDTPVDIILSDITMPLMNGVRLSKMIKEINPYQAIVILSAHNDVSYMVDLFDIGIRQFVHKPFTEEELLYRLLKVCEEIVLENVEKCDFQSVTNIAKSAKPKEDKPNPIGTSKRSEQPSASLETVSNQTYKADVQIVFDYMEDEDLEDIKEHIVRLNSLLLIVGGGDIEYNEVIEVATFLERIGKICSTYSESFPIGMALTHLSRDILDNVTKFQEKSSSLGDLCIAFGQDLNEWIRLIFVDGASNVACMDESIIFNSHMLREMITGESSLTTATNLDDIFDF